MNHHALAPMKYKKSVIIGMIHRIFRACSTYKHFHESLQKARDILLKNQYPESVIDRLIKDTLNKIFEKKETVTESEEVDEEEEKKMVMIEYRGKISDQFKISLNKLNAPSRIIFTLKKLKSVLPSLKSAVDKSLKSGIVYKITCPRCSSCYVGQTRRHLATRIGEHGSAKAPVLEQPYEIIGEFS